MKKSLSQFSLRFGVLLTMTSAVIFLCSVPMVQAATLSVASSANSVKEGNLFTIRVIVNTQDKFINNAEAVINYPAELVEAVSVHSNQSIFSLWAENPSFSNSSGAISFNGGVVNPGFNGAGGEILSATFRAKKAGTASFIISGAAVRENDGLGTDILTGRKSVTIEITPIAPVEVPEKEEEPAKPDEPKETEVPGSLSPITLSSPTHPNQNTWYVAKTATLNWKTPSDAQTVQTIFSRDPGAVPNVSTALGVNSKEIKDIGDGVWYFNIRYQKNNTWSRITSYKLQIDSEAPTDLSVEAHTGDDGRTTIVLQATDLISGIDYYEILRGDTVVAKVLNESLNDPLSLPPLALGEHSFKARVYDKAKNVAEKEIVISVVPVVAPEITYIQETVAEGERVYARGTTPYQNASVVVTMKSPDGKIETYSVTSDNDGNFAFSSEPISSPGTHELWAHIMGAKGEIGPTTEHFTIIAGEQGPGLSEKILGILLDVKFLITVSLLLFFIACFGWFKYFTLKKVVQEYVEKEKNRVVETPPPVSRRKRKNTV